ncbi:MAG: hypothetical protein M3Q23_12115 [Actinomycetota bacterium]|nr:hypothetical protein [Actinomycetota bacterium]
MSGPAATAARGLTGWLGREAVDLLVAAASLVAGGIVAGEFLSVYAAKGFASPVASDTLKYIWRSDLAGVLGLGAIQRVPAGTTVNADRPAFPVLASILHAASGTPALRLAFVVAPVAAVLIGLAAGALAVDGLGEPAWSRPVYGLAVGGSVNVALMSLGYLDNLLVAAVVLACGTCALASVDGRGGGVAASLLLGGAATIHWAFAAVFALVLLGLAVVLVPESLRARRGGGGLLRSPSARLLGITAGGAAAGGALLLLAPSLPQRPLGGRNVFLKKLRLDGPAYRFQAFGPAAGAGAVATAFPATPRRLRGLALLLVWALSAPAAVVALHAGFGAPAHRLIAFALAIPVLVAGLVVAVARAAGHVRWVGRPLGAVVVLAALAGLALLAHGVWFDRAHPVWDVYPLRTYPATQEQATAQARTAGSYLRRYGSGRPVVFVVQPSPTGNSLAVGVAAAGIIRDALPPQDILTTAFFLGRVEDLLAGRPTIEPANRRFDRVALRFWAGVQEVGPHPIVIELAAFNPSPAAGRTAVPGHAISPGVLVVEGPQPAAELPAAATPRRPSTFGLAVLVLGIVAGLAGAGSGWAAALVPGGWLARASLSPALGLVVLSIAGLLADRAGLRLGGGGGVAVLAVSTAAGWALAVGRRRLSDARE